MPRVYPSIEDRLRDYVRTDENGCHIWQSWRDNKGYGAVSYQNKRQLAHRVSYEVAFGPIPKGMCVCHKCDVPPCINPDHLFLGTRKDNSQDMVKKGRANPPTGLAHFRAKLSDTQVQEIRTLLTKRPRGASAAIAAQFGISRCHIYKIKSGRRRAGSIA